MKYKYNFTNTNTCFCNTNIILQIQIRVFSNIATLGLPYMIDATFCVESNCLYLKHCNSNHYEVVMQMKECPSNKIGDYFKNQIDLQRRHAQKRKMTVDD